MSFDSAIACLPLPCPNQCCPSLGSMPAWCSNMRCWKLGTRLRKDGSCPNKWCSLHRPSLRGENLKGVKKQKKDPAPHMDAEKAEQGPDRSPTPRRTAGRATPTKQCAPAGHGAGQGEGKKHWPEESMVQGPEQRKGKEEGMWSWKKAKQQSKKELEFLKARRKAAELELAQIIMKASGNISFTDMKKACDEHEEGQKEEGKQQERSLWA